MKNVELLEQKLKTAEDAIDELRETLKKMNLEIVTQSGEVSISLLITHCRNLLKTYIILDSEVK